MKKQNFLTLAVIAAIFGMVSCNSGYKAKVSNIKTQEDSLNYALGLAYGGNIRMQYFQNDSSAESIAKFVQAADNAFNNQSKDKDYNYGLQIGERFLKAQKKSGLMNDSTLKFNENLILQGLVNGMKGFTEGMTVEKAQQYITSEMQKIQEEKMKKMQQPAPTVPVDTTKVKPAEPAKK